MSVKVAKAKSLLELEAGECRWPVGDPRKPGFHFCGAQQALGRPYCIEHWQLSFVPSKGRQPAAAAIASSATPVALPSPAKKAA